MLISVGGQNGHWPPIFDNPENFVASIAKIIEDNDLDGVDLDIEGVLLQTLESIMTTQATQHRQRV